MRAAVAIRDAIRHEPWILEEHRRPLACAIHSGRLVSMQPGRLGFIAAHVMRLCESAEPWQILVSHATEALLEGEAPEFQLRSLGGRCPVSSGLSGCFRWLTDRLAAALVSVPWIAGRHLTATGR